MRLIGADVWFHGPLRVSVKLNNRAQDSLVVPYQTKPGTMEVNVRQEQRSFCESKWNAIVALCIQRHVCRNCLRLEDEDSPSIDLSQLLTSIQIRRGIHTITIHTDQAEQKHLARSPSVQHPLLSIQQSKSTTLTPELRSSRHDGHHRLLVSLRLLLQTARQEKRR